MRIRRFALISLVAAALSVWLLTGYVPQAKPERLPVVPLAFNGEQAMRYLITLAREHSGRVVGTPQGLAAADYVAEQFRSMGLAVHVQDFREAGMFAVNLNNLGNWSGRWFSGRNVIGVSPGTESGTILFTAHRDVVAKAPEGAYDDGSGTAAVMELARVLSAGPHRYTYVFVALDGEEVGLAGARVLMNRRIPELKQIRLAVNLDMVGHKDAVQFFGAYTQFLSPQAQGLLALVSRAHGIQLSDRPLFASPVGPGTDAALFSFRTVPTLDLHEEVRGRVFNHSPGDTLDQISAESLQRAGRTVEAFVRAGDALASFAPSRGYVASRGEQSLAPWRYRSGGLVILVFLAAPLVLRPFCRWEWLTAQRRPVGTMALLTVVVGVVTLLGQLWSGSVYYVLIPACGALACVIIQAIAQRAKHTPPDPGLGRYLLAALPAIVFAITWWLMGLWTYAFFPAIALYVPALLVTWRPGWGWRLLDVLLLIGPCAVAVVGALGSCLVAPTHIFPPGKLALFAALNAFTTLVCIWGIFGRRPARTARAARPSTSRTATAV